MKSLADISNPSKIQTNSSLDLILGGGIEKRNITQFYGPPGSGKTNISLDLAVQVAKNGKKVAYIDTEGGISIDRVKQLAKNDFEVISNNIIVFEPNSFQEQSNNLKTIESWINSNEDDIDLIIIDSAVALYRLKEGKKSNLLNRELGTQMGSLSRMARKYDIAVVITNQIYSTFEDERSSTIIPVGGTILRYWSKIIVELSKSGINGQRIATLKRHKSIAEGTSIKFSITNNGIE
ncbi:MAG: DNA repair and recombination protein RadB [Methanobrevibacter arboriphilus]|uniref:DNA repair and recombination protein RadB n=1 Tax=Methanobrevibacter arboriphilus TaxID=39441 RepID=A0A843AKB6_METAZ|nr:DNA repair and recombination protein RadB [Methanobrevibacter arboriphilus]MBF4467978.1 DNA repair and recombination protein RadB [Methanobrevibacter arboriphilus]